METKVKVEDRVFIVSDGELKLGDSYVFREVTSSIWFFSKCLVSIKPDKGVIRKKVVHEAAEAVESKSESQ